MTAKPSLKVVSDKAAVDAAAIDIRGLSLTFQTADAPVVALANIDLRSRRGEFVSFIGPSGCGKTTLMRVIADLEQPTAGSITVNGVSPARRGSTAPTATCSRRRRSMPGASVLAQRHAAARDHGHAARGAQGARRQVSRAWSGWTGFERQVPLAALGRHAAARVDRARARASSPSCC